MSTQNLADLPAIAGSSEQRLLLSVHALRISTISGRSLADALKTAHEMHLTEETVRPRKSPNSDLSKTKCSPFLPLLCGGKQKDKVFKFKMTLSFTCIRKRKEHVH